MFPRGKLIIIVERYAWVRAGCLLTYVNPRCEFYLMMIRICILVVVLKTHTKPRVSLQEHASNLRLNVQR